MRISHKQQFRFYKAALRTLMDAAPELTGKNIPLKIKGIPDEVTKEIANREMTLFGQRAAKMLSEGK